MKKKVTHGLLKNQVLNEQACSLSLR